MDLVAPILTIAADLFGCTAKCASYVRGSQENLKCLAEEVALMMRLSEDVENRVQLAAQQRMTAASEVLGWLQDANKEKTEVIAILQDGDALLAKRRCWNIISRYKLGKRVSQEIRRVKELRSRGHFEAVAYGVPRAVVDELPVEETVGLDSLYTEVCSCLADDEIGIVGLFGKRKIGKTTLLKKINNSIMATAHQFDTVIWVSVSKESCEKAAQDVIGNKLQITDNIWQNRSQDEKAIEIFNVMKTKRFLLLLDNVPRPLDLSEIGVPFPDFRNRSKVIITSRFCEICIIMKAARLFEVKPLASEHAWVLFLRQLARDTQYFFLQDPETQNLACGILAKCEGLPSVIIAAARALAWSVDSRMWRDFAEKVEDFVKDEISGEDRFSHPVIADEMPLGYTGGSDSLYVSVCKCLTEPEGGIIGLYGTGGVGKTTLMKKIYNGFITGRNGFFETVIWIAMPKEENVRAAQEVIGNKLQILDSMWQSSTVVDRSKKIFKAMKGKRFLLLLDDIWQSTDLLEIGVPSLPDIQNSSKVLLTTRFQKICNEMEVPFERQFRVEFLTQEEASTLFLEKVGTRTLNSHPDIPHIAKKVIERCKGLPLALVIIGRAMADKCSPEAWDQAIQELENFPTEISGMEDKIFNVLKLSYDSLSDNITKSCFIYCSFFPKGYEIRNDDLIEHWIGEGFFDGEDICEARGLRIIEDLKSACLLEECDGFKECIKMHDIINDMALWIAQECGKMINKALIYESLGHVDVERGTYWKKARTISLWGKTIEKLPKTPDCPNLQTLFVRESSQLKTFPKEFFLSMPLLRVLDLSATQDLIELPDEIDGLVNLEYINLSMTQIKELSIKMMKLKKLRCLILNGMLPLIIPQHLISNLSSLQLFSMYDGNALSGYRAYLLEELESIDPLDEISLSFRSVVALNKLQTSHKLQRCIRRLSIYDSEDLLLLELSSTLLNYLETLVIFNCLNLEEVKIKLEKEGREGSKQSYDVPNLNLIVRNNQHFHRLHDVKIWSCPNLSNLTWLVYASHLQSLDVHLCKSMKEVISFDHVTSSVQDVSMFARLRSLVLGAMPMLESIYQGTLLFPSLEVISVITCPRLGRLPFDPSSAPKSLKKIEGDLAWWESLTWDEEYMEEFYVIYFSPQYLPDPVHPLGEEKGKKKLVIEGSTSSTTA